MEIEVWSDVVCPFCYLGKRRLERALAEFPHRDRVEVRWRSFQLDPAAPAIAELPATELLSQKLGVSPAQVRAMHERLTAEAATLGLDYHLERTRTGNTRAAHRLIHLAAGYGLADATNERFLRAYFTEGEPIGDPSTLTRLAVEVGLPADRVALVLAGDEYAEAVDRDQARARALGANGVPFFVFAGSVGVSGAQPPEVFAEALTRAWATVGEPDQVPAG